MPNTCGFSEHYGQLRTLRAAVTEGPSPIPEEVVQGIWYNRLFRDHSLCLDDGRPLRVVSPGWWNRSEGPDFLGAQLEIGGKLRTGDVEVHLDHGAWKQHGHYLDARYNEVALVVVLEPQRPNDPPCTSLGNRIPSLLLSHYLNEDIRVLADRVEFERHLDGPVSGHGRCAALIQSYGGDRMDKLLHLAGEWRMVNKAQILAERMNRSGPDQAIYETFLSACGYSRFKQHFELMARQLPYDRVRQLARRDPLLAEAALFQIGGLLPENLEPGVEGLPYFARLHALRREHLSGLRSLRLTWKCVGVRPTNYPERRLAGAARFFTRTADEGLAGALIRIWQEDLTEKKRLQAFRSLFPNAMGFWAEHCTWTGHRMERPSAPLGAGRVLSIVGNVFVPIGLALARQRKDRLAEDRVLEFFAALPKEPDNQILKVMLPRIFGSNPKPRLDFRLQQGLLQMFHDWCEPNPSCRNCRVVPYFEVGGDGTPSSDSDTP
ncbi:MAG: DUF2851 family protein [Candidatus Hydrogenedentes bacterium]|nr:DUF2851 family protein [Candidatus Hydrogenedentota bacterium]